MTLNWAVMRATIASAATGGFRGWHQTLARRCGVKRARTLAAKLLRRIQREYEEQPGLCLTPPQAQRLWGLDGPTCGAVLTVLVDAGVLQRMPDGRVVRRHSRV